MKTLSVFIFGVVLLTSCASPLDVLETGQEKEGTYLVLSDTTGLIAGQQLRISASKEATENYSHGRLPKILGRVEIVRLGEDHKVFVKVINGTIAGAGRAWRNQ